MYPFHRNKITNMYKDELIESDEEMAVVSGLKDAIERARLL